MAQVPSYKAVFKHYDKSPENIRRYFDQLPQLLKQDFPYEVSLAYLFLRTERAQNRALYCGVVKLHKAHAEVAENAVNAQHLTRKGFLDLYQTIFDKKLPDAIHRKIETAESIRDKVIHGKSMTDKSMREAHCDIIDYATELNKELLQVAGFEPFGSIQGFKGRGQSLDKKTSKWLLKGMGFSIA